MTRTIAIFPNTNDVYRNISGDLKIVMRLEAVAYLCKTAMQAQRGEMVLAADQGMPTFETAWDTYNPAQFEAAARTVLTAIPDVLAVETFSVERQGEVLRYTATIRTVYGETVLNERL